MTHEFTPATLDQQRSVGARFMCATALAYLNHGLSVDVISVDEHGGAETTGGFRVIDSFDNGRISMVGQAVQLAWLTDSLGQAAAIQRSVDGWRETVVYAIQDEEEKTSEEGILSGGSILVSAPWAVTFVAVNDELITELAALLLASGGHLEPDAFLPVVEGRIKSVSVEDNARAFQMLEPYLEQLEEIEVLRTKWQLLANR